MAMGAGTGLNQSKSDINVTPLIDVLLVLLIIFMMVTPLLTMAMNSDLPKKAAEPLPEEYSERQLVLSIHNDGRFFLNKEEVPLTGVASRIRGALSERTQKVLFLDAEDGVPYGTVVQAMDLCVGAGAEHVALVTESLEAAASTAATP
ncbi:MAG TPA: biopolymer transporter ExbD [Dongiaceae bacterium]|jgi:biopolymer transport protein TolR|nr:biopolymer transporter ExbD [Dongiaceae bacterium]